METNIRTIIHLVSILFVALSAGLFYGWAASVIPGTLKISNQAYVETMQSINREILNPWFFIVFFGAVILLIASTFFQFQFKMDAKFYLILAATIVYLIGTIGVTMVGNVPLNNTLEAFHLTNFSLEDFKNARLAYEDKWNQFHMVRTVAAVISLILLLIGITK